jgi:hypothetical protein
LEDTIPIYAAVAISEDYEDGIDYPKYLNAATESPHTEKWNMAMKEVLDPIGPCHVFEDFVALPVGR